MPHLAKEKLHTNLADQPEVLLIDMYLHILGLCPGNLAPFNHGS